MDETVVAKTESEVGKRGLEHPGADEVLFELAAYAPLVRAADGRLHARVPVNGRQEIYGLKSSAFRNWLIDRYRSVVHKLPPERAVRRVVEALEARAQFADHTPPVYVRVGRGLDADASTFYLDLGNSSRQAVEIRASGWSIVDNPPVHFSRPRGLLPMPVPSHEGSIELLRPFVNLIEPEFRLLVCWLVAALRPGGPFSVLVFNGEQGTSKTTLARVGRQLIDPQTAPLLAEPHSTRDLMVTAVNGWLLAYDNISALPGWLSDGFCRVASGGGFAARTLYSNEDRSAIYIQRPIMLNGIEEFVRKGDLADRGVFLHLPPIQPSERRDEEDFWGAFHEVQAGILGGLLDAMVGALRVLPSLRIEDLPRMADFARFGEAVGRGLGWPEGAFLQAYRENRWEARVSTIENSVLGMLLLREAAEYNLDWCDSPTRLLQRLNHVTKDRSIRAQLPKTPSALGNELRRLAPQLREYGVDVKFKKTRGARVIAITSEGVEDPWEA